MNVIFTISIDLNIIYSKNVRIQVFNDIFIHFKYSTSENNLKQRQYLKYIKIKTLNKRHFTIEIAYNYKYLLMNRHI